MDDTWNNIRIEDVFDFVSRGLNETRTGWKANFAARSELGVFITTTTITTYNDHDFEEINAVWIAPNGEQHDVSIDFDVSTDRMAGLTFTTKNILISDSELLHCLNSVAVNKCKE